MACTLQRSAPPTVTARLSEKLGKLWIAAEILLFVLVGAAVDIRYTMNAGALAVLMIFLALSIRSLGVLLCLWRTPLNKKERLFCVIAYLPKATVQAAAEREGESINGYTNKALLARMGLTAWPEGGADEP